MSFPPALNNLMDVNFRLLTQKQNKDYDTILVNKLRRALGRDEKGVEFEGSMLSHDEPSSLWILFKPALSEQEAKKALKVVKKILKGCYYELYEKNPLHDQCRLKYCFIPREDFIRIQDEMGFSILMSDVEHACSEVMDWLSFKADESADEMAKHISTVQDAAKFLQENCVVSLKEESR